jgi:protein-tyrosine phosphatase
MEYYSNGIKSILNFRDAGGIPLQGGKKMKRGLLYRSANPDRISAKDIEKLKHLGIKTVIDLRAPYEYTKKKVVIPGVEVINIPLDFEQKTREQLVPLIKKRVRDEKILEVTNELYTSIIDGAGGAFRQLAEILLDSNRTPVLFHCQAGKDRTGILAALVQLLAGAEREPVIDEYLKSNAAILPYFRKKMLPRKIITFGYFPADLILYAITVREKNISSVIDRVNTEYGGTESYLAATGFNMDRLQELRGILVEQS